MRSRLSVLLPQSNGNALATDLMRSKFLSAAAMRSEASHHQDRDHPMGAAPLSAPRPDACKLGVVYRLMIGCGDGSLTE